MIVAPMYDGVRGNPVLFDRTVFGELLAVTGDQGAREVITRDPRRVVAVPFPFAMPADIDSLADLEHARLRERDGL
jgi:molybdenum cofactor cytidylyltransferase